MVVDLNHPTAGPIRMLGIPFSFSQTPASIAKAPPPLGADTDGVLSELLELNPAEIQEFRRDGVI